MSVELQSVSEDDRLELRLAVVMTGGVSLAVWMGGVAHELNRVVRSDADAYQQLLDLTDCDARVDVIAGTSAGGLNGSLLAMAQVHDSDMTQVRDLWLDQGELEALLRSPGDADPPSLMRGDEYFMPGIRDALKALVNRGPEDLPDPDDVPIHLIITSTLLDGMHRGVPDSFGSIVHDRDNRGEFQFRRGGGLTHHAEDCIHKAAVDKHDDFAEPGTLMRMALASRSTASFPFAFEPSFCPIGDGTDERPDMACHANFPVSRYVIDGGVLVNQPLGPALRAIFAQQAANQVRRVLCFIVPDPGTEVSDTPDQQTPMPSLAQVGYASLIKLPRNQSIFSELDQIRTHNLRVAGQRRRRQAAVESQRELVPIAAPLYDRYRRMRAELLADEIVQLIARGATESTTVRSNAGDLPLWDQPVLRQPFVDYLSVLPPEEFPGEHAPVERWFTTLGTVERAGALALDMLARALRITNPRDPDTAEARRALRACRLLVHGALGAARSARAPLAPKEKQDVADQALAALEDGKLEEAEVLAIVRRVHGDPSELAPSMTAIAAAMAEGAPVVRSLCDRVEAQGKVPKEPVRETRKLAEAFIVEAEDAAAVEREILRRLVALEVVQLALADQPPTVEQPVELLQLSADTPNGFSAQATAEGKLAGLQMAHFGAFYKRSWRANDWMWGRLDAAQRLSSVLLEPARLRQLGYSSADVLKTIEDIAFGKLDAADKATLEDAQPMRWDPAAAKRELSYLDEPGKRPPSSLPMCSQAVARRLQLDILREELGPVAQAVRDDVADGAARTDSSRFAERVLAAGKRPSAAAVVELFRLCKIGREKVEMDGSELMARTASQSAAVTTAAVGGTHSGLGTRALKLRRSVRGVGLALFLMVQNATAGTRTGAMAVTAALAAGGALLAIGLLAGHGGAQVLGAVLLLGGLGVAGLRNRWRGALVGMLVAAAAAAAPRVAVFIADRVESGGAPEWAHDGLDTFETIWVVLWLVLGAVWLGTRSVVWPPEDEQKPAAQGTPAA